MDLFKTKLVAYTVAIGLIITALVGGIIYYTSVQLDWNWFSYSALFFLIIEPLLIYFIATKSQKIDKKHMVNMYMSTKIVKIIGALILITAYALTIKENLKVFVIVFISFYLLYLLVETLLFVRIEKHIKEKSSSNE